MILEYDKEIRDSGAFARDQQRWPQGLHARSCEELISYAKARLDFLDKALYNLELFDKYDYK